MLRNATWLLVLTLPGLAGCGSYWAGRDRVQVWAVPQGVTVFPDAAPDLENEVFSAADGRIRLGAAVNEVVAFQLVFRGDEAGSIWGVTVGDLHQGDHVIPADQVALFREARVPVSEYPTWYLRLTPHLRRLRQFPDLLVPLSAPRGALPIALAPGACEVVWVEIRVPPGTPAGKYRSVVRATTRAGSTRNLDLVLEVWPFALTGTRHLAILAGVDTARVLERHLEVDGRPYAPGRLSFDDPVYPRAAAVLDATLQLLHEHRCSSMLRDLQPVREMHLGGRLELGWGDYDRLVAGVLDGSAFADRVAAVAWPMPIDDRRPSPEAHGGWGSPGYEGFVVDYLRQCVSHFVDRGWLDRHFVWIPTGGESQAERYRRFERMGRLIREADPRLRAVCTLPPHSMADYGWREEDFIDVSSLVGIWAPPASLMDPDALARQLQAGKRVWLNPARPPYSGSLSMLAPPVHARSLAWQAYRTGCDGVLLGAVNAWPEDGLPAAAGSEACLVWPGKAYGLEAPIPSIRLKRLRRGAQDYEYLWLLERHHRPGLARLIAEGLFSFGGTACYGEHALDGRPNGWVTNPAAWSLARRLMARELMLAMEEQDQGSGDSEAGGIERFERQLEWARLTTAVRSVRVEFEGARVPVNAGHPGEPVILEVATSVFNGTRKPVAGRLVLADAPEGWVLREPVEQIEGLGPLCRTSRVMCIQADAVRPNVEGVMPIRVALADGSKELASDAGRLCVLVSRELTHTLTVDGKLDDWPLGSGNVAGDFVLVGAADVPKRGRPSADRPSQATLVFVAHDRDFLYVAFHCADDHLAERRVARDNVVHYDELWPVGDDLVEVLLDPTGRAVHSGDLLHIVVKANGAVVTERGVPCLAQVAGHSAWPANVIAAVDEQAHPDRWTVEIRIPLRSLGARAEVCGINFARFQPRLGEYASWSGARRHLYAPATLGNLRLPL